LRRHEHHAHSSLLQNLLTVPRKGHAQDHVQ
jgi:hypothetical protein